MEKSNSYNKHFLLITEATIKCGFRFETFLKFTYQTSTNVTRCLRRHRPILVPRFFTAGSTGVGNKSWGESDSADQEHRLKESCVKSTKWRVGNQWLLAVDQKPRPSSCGRGKPERGEENLRLSCLTSPIQ